MRPSTEIDTLRQQLPYRRLRQVKKGKVLPIDWPTEWERFDANELFAFDLATIPPTMLENMRKRQEVSDGWQPGGHFGVDPPGGRSLRLSHHPFHPHCRNLRPGGGQRPKRTSSATS